MRCPGLKNNGGICAAIVSCRELHGNSRKGGASRLCELSRNNKNGVRGGAAVICHEITEMGGGEGPLGASVSSEKGKNGGGEGLPGAAVSFPRKVDKVTSR